MEIINTGINDLNYVSTKSFNDHRGSFSRLFCKKELELVIGKRELCQINLSHNIATGSIRGMHYQKEPYQEMKCIRCLRGRVFDVAIDLREDSNTFLKWFGIELSKDNNLMMIIPEGFAHGFQVLEPESSLLYIHTEFYHPEAEDGLNPLDPMLNIEWPLPISMISNKDRNRTYLENREDE